MPDKSQKSPPVVMIVDGDPYVRELAGHFLAEVGYEVEFALNGYEALDRCRESPPAVLLADIIIPKLDGTKADSYLSKPLEKKRLLDAVAEMIEPLRST
jgi:CheY-like chemotaxis protein